MARMQHLEPPKTPVEFAALFWTSSPFALNDANLERLGDVLGRVQQRAAVSAQRQARLWSDFAERAAGCLGDMTAVALPPASPADQDDSLARARASSEELLAILRAVADEARDLYFGNAQDVMEGLQAAALEAPSAAKASVKAGAKAVKAAVSQAQDAASPS